MRMDMHMDMHVHMHMHMRMLHVCPGVGRRTDRLVQPDEASRPTRVKRTLSCIDQPVNCCTLFR